MSSQFRDKKNYILKNLALDSPDASPKGQVDEEILPLVYQLNEHSGIVTTSSCAGRIAVFLEGVKKRHNCAPTTSTFPDEEVQVSESPGSARHGTAVVLGADASRVAGIGGKGHGGHWVFVSHTPVQTEALSWGKLIGDTFSGYTSCIPPQDRGENYTEQSKSHIINEESRLLHFKFEPMILHIMTDTLELAHQVLKLALSSGFRESGIMNPALPATLAIRTTGLAFDCIIGHYDTNTRKTCQTVDDVYLQMLSIVANSRFKENEKRRGLFSKGMHLIPGVCQNQSSTLRSSNWEDTESRKERKRLEGLARSSKLRESKEFHDRDHSFAMAGSLEEEELPGVDQLITLQ